jgi:hypothetical protein
MRNLLYLKIATIVTFLLIVFPGKLSVFNGITIFIGLCVSILEVFYITDDFMFILKQLLVSIVIILSIGLLLNKKKYLNLICIIIQYSYILFLSKMKFLTYWYYTLPTSVYVILSLTVLYVVFVKRYPEKEFES